MKVDLLAVNPGLVSLDAKPNQIITLDANFLIPPDRQALPVRGIPFPQFQVCECSAITVP